MAEYIGYIYKTTNLINSKIYIGQHQSKKQDDNYFGSGRILLNALKKYGKESFTVEIIYWAKSMKRLNDAEILFIEAYDATNPEVGYNLSYGGVAFNKGRKASEETREKQRQSALNKPPMSDESKAKLSESLKKVKHAAEWCKKIGRSNKGKHSNLLTEDHKRKISESLSGKVFSEEHKNKIRQSSIGNKSRTGMLHTEETKRKMSESQLGHKGYMLGRHLTEEQRKKVSEAKKIYWVKKRMEEEALK